MHQPFPDKKYAIIYADPPWSYSAGGIRSAKAPSEVNSRVTDHYPTMPTADICALPVQDIADDDCLLFMWATSPCLEDAFEVGKAWEFKYITVGFVWRKGSPIIGNYTMSECEYVLIFKKGKIPQPRGARNIKQFLDCPKGRHSEKPKEIRERIKMMFPEQSKIELFARPVEFFGTYLDDGFDKWGNEV